MVALDGPNSPEYLIMSFAIDSVGAVPCFINYNLTSQSLEHCIKVLDEEIRHLAEPVAPKLESCTMVYYSKQYLSSLPFDATPPPPEQRSNIDPTSPRLLMFTSGTTGLPKALVKATSYEVYSGLRTALYLGLKPTTRFYTCLPLFHGAAHTLCLTAVLHAGCTLILGTKFSHSTFWPEVVTHKADIMQYVGELCRYLLNGKPSPLDRQHNLKMAWGNGMRPDVWEPFRQRFGIPIIHELYAATDGMGSMFNLNKGEFSRHAIGVRGLLWNMINGPREKIVRIDVDTQEILRDPKTGFATECPRGEAGETIHWIDPAAPLAKVHFQGYYKNEEATRKRFIRDVFQKDDMWFRSGDMMRQEETGCVYFADRLGDTFRWKSENVSTNEVSDLLGQFPGIAECNVYGVLVPNADGRAGCAAIVLSEGLSEDKFDFKGLAEHALALMPRYAAPVFLRLTSALGYTSTMKLQKGKLRQEGCDIEKAEASGDKLYWLPPNKANYVPFTREEYIKIQNGQIQL
ncbi:fatty acid transporter protein [Penicillium riverlandense]|uniref:fatty acid transporter protein n=1 Tax=Penicillium riverlandense TaxID=1903569 RepID=UPI0025468650|nr:fatty acid transporter protein [Penicillium riverlandense]KAJ5814797.1 fatty acid transporter protein [Penicillium riverlandense]